MRPVDLSPIGAEQQTETPFDLFLIFAGANIVATTLQVGASLPPSFSLPVARSVIAAGAVGGAALVAALAPIGTRLRVPSIVASRAALGIRAPMRSRLLLFVTNFAWIAVNNVIAASICARLYGGERRWRVGRRARARGHAHCAGGPRAVAPGRPCRRAARWRLGRCDDDRLPPSAVARVAAPGRSPPASGSAASTSPPDIRRRGC